VRLSGAILGMVKNDQGDWLYTVSMLETEECWDLMESELKETGELLDRDALYSGDSVKVDVDIKTGEGRVKS